MAQIAIKIQDQLLHFYGRSLDPLEEDTAAENQHPSVSTFIIAALRPFDDAADFALVDAFGGTTAVHKSFKKRRGVFQIRAA
ncbi:hypothetical protein U1872_15770 [Sphingomonas sp. RB3P16]